MSTKKTVTDAGFKPSSDDRYKSINGSSYVVQRPGEGIIINHGGRHNHYGSNTSDSFIANRLKK